jgi:hypothetical protein
VGQVSQLRGPSGQLVDVDDAHLQGAIEAGYQPVGGAEASDLATARDTSAASGIGGAISAGVGSLASGATVGLSDVALRGILSKGDMQGMRDAREAHPYISTAGNIVGALAPALLGDEAGLARLTPSGLTSRLGARIAERTGGMVGTIAAGAVEGGIQSTGAYVSDVALGNRDLSSEGFIGAMGKGAFYGGVGAGALSVASNGIIAARKLFPVEDLTAEGVQAAKFGAKRAIGDSIDTSSGLETAGRAAVSTTDRETQQFITDLEHERTSGMGRAPEAAPIEAGGAPQDPAMATGSAPIEAPAVGDPAPSATVAEPVSASVNDASIADTSSPDAPSARQSWREWTKGKMGPYMKSEGGHGPAMTAMSRDYKAYVAELEADAGEAAGSAASEVTSGSPALAAADAPKDARGLLKAWREKFPEGAVDYDAANAASRRQRLSEWAKDFEAKTPQDETIKAYFNEPMDPMRTAPDVRVGDINAPKAVQAVARQNAALASHEAYIAATADAANVSQSGTELMARATYAGRKAAAQAMDDVYAAYAAGKPIIDIRAAATQRLSGQLHELAEARADMISSLAKAPDDLTAQLQAMANSKEPLSLGQRILHGVDKPIDPDTAVENALAKSKDVNEDIGSIAPKITRYEAAKANLTEALGDTASQQAKEHAAQFRAAQAQSQAANANNTVRDVDSLDAMHRGVPATALPHGKSMIGGLAKRASDLGTVYEALRSIGVPLPDPHSVPVIGPILSAFLKAKLISKVAGKFGGSFAATAEGTIAAKAVETQNRINGAMSRMLTNTGERLAVRAPDIGGAAALGFKLFDTGKAKKPYSSEPAAGDISALYTQRLAELATSQQPDAIAQAVKQRVNTSDPTILHAIIATETNKLTYLYNQAPKPDGVPLPGQSTPLPSKAEMVAFGHITAAAHDPAAVFERVADGGIARPAEVDAVRNCYPQLYAQAQRKLVDMLSKPGAAAPYMRRVAISALTGIPMDPTLKPDHAAYLQASNTTTASAAPMPHPTLTSSMSIGDRTLTRLDR